MDRPYEAPTKAAHSEVLKENRDNGRSERKNDEQMSYKRGKRGRQNMESSLAGVVWIVILTSQSPSMNWSKSANYSFSTCVIIVGRGGGGGGGGGGGRESRCHR